jgi:thioredoxin 1
MNYFKNTTPWVILGIAAIFSTTFFSCTSSTPQEDPIVSEVEGEDLGHGSTVNEGAVLSLEEEFEQSIAGEKLTMVDFYAEWCRPCKMMAPYVTQIKKEQSDIVNVLQIDAEQYMDISQRYNLEGYPTLIFFKNGKIVDRAIGYLEKDRILEYVNRLK